MLLALLDLIQQLKGVPLRADLSLVATTMSALRTSASDSKEPRLRGAQRKKTTPPRQGPFCKLECALAMAVLPRAWSHATSVNGVRSTPSA